MQFLETGSQGAFHAQTQPVIEYYKRKGMVYDLVADKPAADVTSQVRKALS